MKFKKICSLIMTTVLTTAMFSNASVRAAPSTGIQSTGKEVRITTQGIPATSATTYRTIGWTVSHENYNMIMDKTTTKVEDLGGGASRFTLPLAGSNSNSIYAQMGGEKSPKLINFFYNGGTLLFNARMTVYEAGRPTGELYTTKDGIASARGWAGNRSQFDSYFDQKLRIPPQDVLVNLKVAHQLLNENGNRIGPNKEPGGPPIHSNLIPALVSKGKKIKPARDFDNLTFKANEYDDYEFAYSSFSPDGGVGHDTLINKENQRTFNFNCPSKGNIVDNKGNFINGQKYLIFYYKPKDAVIEDPKDGNVSLIVEADGDGTVTGSGTKKLVDGKATFDNITATPNKDSVFLNWTIEYGDQGTPEINNSVTITKNTKLVAHFIEKNKLVPKLVNLSVKAHPEYAGTVTGSGNKMLINGKATFNGIAQKPNPNEWKGGKWVFDHWSITKGDKIVPTNGKATITQDTILVANYRLEPLENIKPEAKENSDLKVEAKIDRNPAKEGQLITFTIDTYSNDYKYPIWDSRGWSRSRTPRSVFYRKDSKGFAGELFGLGEQSQTFSSTSCSRDSDGHRDCTTIYWTEYYQEYKGRIYRKPIQWFSAEKLRLYFPNEIKNLPTLNDYPIDPYVEWYISSKPSYLKSKNYGEVIRHNKEKIEFYLPLEVPVTIKNNGIRIREPYKIRVEAIETNGKIKADTYVDLDIKGNIYEHIYTTPIG